MLSVSLIPKSITISASWTNATATAFWQAYMANFSSWMAPNITASSLCMYQVSPDGTFGLQARSGNDKIGRDQESFAWPLLKKKHPELKQYPLIDANYPGGGAAMRKMWATNVSRQLFINAALQKLHEQGFHGYNLVGTTMTSRFCHTVFSLQASISVAGH